MIIIMERNATKVQIQRVIDFLKDNGFDIRLWCKRGKSN